jgi:hypothetical protein
MNADILEAVAKLLIVGGGWVMLAAAVWATRWHA